MSKSLPVVELYHVMCMWPSAFHIQKEKWLRVHMLLEQIVQIPLASVLLGTARSKITIRTCQPIIHLHLRYEIYPTAFTLLTIRLISPTCSRHVYLTIALAPDDVLFQSTASFIWFIKKKPLRCLLFFCLPFIYDYNQQLMHLSWYLRFKKFPQFFIHLDNKRIRKCGVQKDTVFHGRDAVPTKRISTAFPENIYFNIQNNVLYFRLNTYLNLFFTKVCNLCTA